MNIPFSLFLAARYLRPKRTFTSVISIISVLGVLLPVAVIVIVISVMAGFGELWQDKLLGFNAHINLTAWAGMEDFEAVQKKVDAVPGVVSSGPYVQTLTVVDHRGMVHAPFVRGVDPEAETRVTKLDQYIIAGEFLIDDEHVVLGSEAAHELRARVGDRINVFSPKSFSEPDAIQLPEELTVSGVFEVGMYDIDLGFMVTSLDTARRLAGLGDKEVHGLQIMLANPGEPFSVKTTLEEALGPGYRAFTWIDMNQTLFSALRTEKNMMFFILFIVSSVGALLIMNTLFMVSFQKTREIGLLKALGFQSSALMRVFVWYGLVMGVLGTVFGVGLGLLILKYRNALLTWINATFHSDLLPANLYQLGEIPAVTSTEDVLFIAVSVILLCVLAACVPAARAANLDPVKALRHE